MKNVQLIHNPGAGDESHTKDKLKELLRQNGFECNYTSTKKNDWKDFDKNADVILIAGGDGTIRKVVEVILGMKLLDLPAPIALLPLGTANNISRSLHINKDLQETIGSWDRFKTKSFDVGRVFNVDEVEFFLESFGYGIFPYLMQVMKKQQMEFESPEEKIKGALQVLYEITQDYEPRKCQLVVDGTDHSGKFILVEIMNTPSLGPNLEISPLSDPSDGEFEVVLVPEQQKDKFLKYIENKLEGKDVPYSFHTLKGRNITMDWDGTHVHVDDEVVKLAKGIEVKVRMKKGLLEFFVD